MFCSFFCLYTASLTSHLELNDFIYIHKSLGGSTSLLLRWSIHKYMNIYLYIFTYRHLQKQTLTVKSRKLRQQIRLERMIVGHFLSKGSSYTPECSTSSFQRRNTLITTCFRTVSCARFIAAHRFKKAKQ